MIRARVVLPFLAAALAAPAVQAGTTPAPVIISCANLTAARGSTAAVQVSMFREGEALVAGTQNDLEFDSTIFGIASDDCVINPDIGPGTPADKQLATNLLSDPPRVRNLVVALENVNIIPPGLLYTCTFQVDGNAPLGDTPLAMSGVLASDPDGNRLPVSGTGCTVTVAEATPTATPVGFCEDDDDCPPGQVCVDNRCVTPTPSPTPIGFCEDDDDCPPGEVCVDNRCVTPTPSPTPIGFCEDDDDCPPGQVCVDNRCVTPTPTPTPATPTPRRGGGGGGCSCRIDPGAPISRPSEWLAAVLPALVLWLRWRARKR